jgi:four helix bundle protein
MNMPITHQFEDLEVWKESRILLKEIRIICKQPKVAKDFSFVDQITRAARSISSNIAEGSESSSNEQFNVFLNYSKRSCGEVRSHLYDALEENYLSPEKFEELKNKTIVIGRRLGSFMKYLDTHSRRSSPVARNP